MNKKEIAELKKIEEALDVFRMAMQAKMVRKFADGYRGWDKKYPMRMVKGCIHEKAAQIVHDNKDEQAVDLANFAMMVWYRSKK